MRVFVTAKSKPMVIVAAKQNVIKRVKNPRFNVSKNIELFLSAHLGKIDLFVGTAIQD